MAHIFSECQKALTQERYSWRHDKVLRELADMEVDRRRKRPTDQKPGQIQFVNLRQSEATIDKRAPSRKSVLNRGHDWELRVDLDRKPVFPNILETNLKPDAVLVSQQSKTLVAIELTVPREENCEEAPGRKSLKFADPMADCKDKGWSVWLFPVEVGCRVFPAQSVWKLFTRLGVSERTPKQQQKDREKQQNGHPVGSGTAETICDGSRKASSSGLATTANSPTGGCHGLGSKHPVKVGDLLKRSDLTDEHPGAKL